MDRGSTRAPFLALLAAAFVAHELLPDPLAAAIEAARQADSTAVAQLASSRAPRDARGHLITAALAAEDGDADAARVATARAGRAAPWFGEVQRSVADAQLVDAVERSDDVQLAAASRAYANAVAVDALACEVAYQALAAAGAPAALLEQVAGDDRTRREALVDHWGRGLDEERALELAAALDREAGGATTRARALARRRLGGSSLAAQRPADALRHFEQAALLVADPDAHRLDRAVACLALGDAAHGAGHLLRALELGAVDGVAAAACLRAATDPAAASAALFEQLRFRRDRGLERALAPLFAALDQPERAQALALGSDRP